MFTYAYKYAYMNVMKSMLSMCVDGNHAFQYSTVHTHNTILISAPLHASEAPAYAVPTPTAITRPPTQKLDSVNKV